MGNIRQVTIMDYKLAKEAMASTECSDRSPLLRTLAIHPKDDGGGQ